MDKPPDAKSPPADVIAQSLRASEEKYRNIFEYASVGIYQVSPQGKLLTANPTLARMLGYDSVQELYALIDITKIYMQPADREILVKRYETGQDTVDFELLWKKKSGEPIWIQLNAHVVKDSSGQAAYFEGFVHDISERKRSEELLRQQSIAFDASMDGIAITDSSGAFVYMNGAYAHLYGYEPNELIGQPWNVLYDVHGEARFRGEILPSMSKHGHWSGEGEGKRRDGSRFPQDVSVTQLEGGGFVLVVRDITERKKAEEQIRHLAYHDRLTRLPNRLLFEDRLALALPLAERVRAHVGVLFLDLDGFKLINDSLGHGLGDALLQAVARRIHDTLRETDTVSRFGGDEFTVLLPLLSGVEDGGLTAKKILESLRQPFHIGTHELSVTASIGVAVSPAGGRTPEELIKHADIAMYHAKEMGHDNFQLFSDVIRDNAIERLTLETSLRKAVIAQELFVHYQPIINATNGQVVSLEALLRWRHPTLGVVLPSAFIPLAEATGLMGTIGPWVSQAALSQLREWRDAGRMNLRVSLNLSVSQMQQGDLAPTLLKLMDEYGVPPQCVEVEITEGAAMQYPELAIRSLQQLRTHGVRVSLDDFGTGYSSLSYLTKFPIDTLKIDRSFVLELDRNAKSSVPIVSAVMAMSHALGLDVIAEGVESEQQRDILLEHGCRLMQGHLFSPPVPPELLAPLLEGIQ